MKRKSQSWVETYVSVQYSIWKLFFGNSSQKLRKKSIYQSFFPCSILLTFLHFCVLTFLYFFTFGNILSLILGSISTILLSWLKARNKMFACWVPVTWLFWLKMSSRGFALYFHDIVRGGLLLYEVSTRNSPSISSTTWIGILVWLTQLFLFLCHTLQ